MRIQEHEIPNFNSGHCWEDTQQLFNVRRREVLLRKVKYSGE